MTEFNFTWKPPHTVVGECFIDSKLQYRVRAEYFGVKQIVKKLNYVGAVGVSEEIYKFIPKHERCNYVNKG